MIPHQSLVDWDQLYRTATAFARIWCRNVEAPDVAHDALLQLISARTTIRDPVPWLFVVTRRLAAKSERLQNLWVPEDRLFSSGREPAAAFGHALPSLLRTLIQHRHLKPRDRRVLVLVAMGYSHAEIAGRLGCARQDIGQYVSRAMRRLVSKPDVADSLQRVGTHT